MMRLRGLFFFLEIKAGDLEVYWKTGAVPEDWDEILS